MSVVVVLKDNDKYIVGCDTRLSSSYEYTDSYYGMMKAKHTDFNNEVIVAVVR